MKTLKRIKAEIKFCQVCQEGMRDCEPDDSLIYQGWVEALEWVIDEGQK